MVYGMHWIVLPYGRKFSFGKYSHNYFAPGLAFRDRITPFGLRYIIMYVSTRNNDCRPLKRTAVAVVRGRMGSRYWRLARGSTMSLPPRIPAESAVHVSTAVNHFRRWNSRFWLNPFDVDRPLKISPPPINSGRYCTENVVLCTNRHSAVLSNITIYRSILENRNIIGSRII